MSACRSRKPQLKVVKLINIDDLHTLLIATEDNARCDCGCFKKENEDMCEDCSAAIFDNIAKLYENNQ
jgi:hypothetical protein